MGQGFETSLPCIFHDSYPQTSKPRWKKNLCGLLLRGPQTRLGLGQGCVRAPRTCALILVFLVHTAIAWSPAVDQISTVLESWACSWQRYPQAPKRGCCQCARRRPGEWVTEAQSRHQWESRSRRRRVRTHFYKTEILTPSHRRLEVISLKHC